MKRKLALMAESLDLIPLPASIVEYGHCVFAAAIHNDSNVWVAAAAMRRHFPEGLTGDLHSSRLGFLLVMPYSSENTAVMRRIFPWAAPTSLRNKPMVWSIPPKYAEYPPAPFPPVLRLPANAEAAITALNRWNQEQFQSGHHIRFATEYRGTDPEAALACGASRFVWIISPQPPPAAVPVSNSNAWREYADRRFILDGAVLHFTAETAAVCTTGYTEVLHRARRFRNRVRRERGDDFLLSLRLPPMTPIQETLHFFYLLRELRKCGWYSPGLVPHQPQLTAELIAVARLDICPLIWDRAEPPPQMPKDLPCQVYRDGNG